MEKIAEWVKNCGMIFIFMMAVTSITAKKEYRQYIRFFAEFILVLTLSAPILKWFGGNTDFSEKTATEEFLQNVYSIQRDWEKTKLSEKAYYKDYYEKLIETELAAEAEYAGYTAVRTKVELNEDYEPKEIHMEVAKKEEETTIAGTLEKEEDTNLLRLKEHFSEAYNIEESRIKIRD